MQKTEGKAKEKETGEGESEDDREGDPALTEDVSSCNRPSESATGATKCPAASSPTATKLPATHPATSCPTTTPPVAEGTGVTAMPYPTYAVEPLVAEPAMAHSVSEPVAFGSSHVGIHEPPPCHEPDAFPGTPVRVCHPRKPANTMPKHGFTSLSGLRGTESCGGRKQVVCKIL